MARSRWWEGGGWWIQCDFVRPVIVVSWSSRERPRCSSTLCTSSCTSDTTPPCPSTVTIIFHQTYVRRLYKYKEIIGSIHHQMISHHFPSARKTGHGRTFPVLICIDCPHSAFRQDHLTTLRTCAIDVHWSIVYDYYRLQLYLLRVISLAVKREEFRFNPHPRDADLLRL